MTELLRSPNNEEVPKADDLLSQIENDLKKLSTSNMFMSKTPTQSWDSEGTGRESDAATVIDGEEKIIEDDMSTSSSIERKPQDPTPNNFSSKEDTQHGDSNSKSFHFDDLPVKKSKKSRHSLPANFFQEHSKSPKKSGRPSLGGRRFEIVIEGKIEQGHRLHARAKEIENRLEEKRANKEEPEEYPFAPNLVSKQRRFTHDNEEVSRRLYHHAQMKQEKDKQLAQKLVVEPVTSTSRVSFGKEGKIPPQVAVYERGIAFLQSVEKRKKELEAKITPCFTPSKYTKSESNEKGSDTTTFCERLYKKDYLKKRDKMLHAIKKKVDLVGHTFMPVTNKFSVPTKPSDDSINAWERLHNISKKKKEQLLGISHTFKPNISLSQKNINPESTIPAYQRLHSHNALISLKREMKIAMNEDKESTHTPKINNNINIAQVEFEDRFEHL
eukprot:CAMPEP_0194409688 /NCGR_PEP_ID=MMETSP0176-20130528/7579_1 /TAXON_ID=216777 /ORGANISM="Proboscia alata, Strain PI-D3" /LENGTH=441 /DNA_ID=CAMNT_0039210469 /DNA_START=70 /DNA_END=1395 /DNA_ORIENTATION=+